MREDKRDIRRNGVSVHTSQSRGSPNQHLGSCSSGAREPWPRDPRPRSVAAGRYWGAPVGLSQPGTSQPTTPPPITTALINTSSSDKNLGCASPPPPLPWNNDGRQLTESLSFLLGHNGSCLRCYSVSASVSLSLLNFAPCTSHSHNTLPQSTLSSEPSSYLTLFKLNFGTIYNITLWPKKLISVR